MSQPRDRKRCPLRCRIGLAVRLTMLAILAATAGCGRDGVRVYRAPKDAPAPESGHAHAPAPAMPRVRWTTPAGWEERQAEGIRAARLAIPSKEGQESDVSVIPMPGVTAGRHDIVNLWRQQVKLDPLSEEAIAQAAVKVPIGESEGEYFEMASEEPLIDDKHKARILVAMVKLGEITWFFKVTGIDGEVAGQKPAFLEFLKSIQFEEPPAGPAATAPAVAGASPEAGGGAARPEWQVPPGWKEVPPTTMLLAKFMAEGPEGSAEITVSSFPGDTGGLVANVNRWRGQVGLAPQNAEEVNREVTPLDVTGGKGMLVDLAGDQAGRKVRLVGVIVPRQDETWFYKMTGDAAVVEREKPALVRFVEAVRYP